SKSTRRKRGWRRVALVIKTNRRKRRRRRFRFNYARTFVSFVASCKDVQNAVDQDMTALQRWWRGLLEFLFPPETDTWLAILRIGLGLQVAVYALFLRSDWHYLFSGTGEGLVSRELGEAIASFYSPLIPKLGWLVACGQRVRLREETFLVVV